MSPRARQVLATVKSLCLQVRACPRRRMHSCPATVHLSNACSPLHPCQPSASSIHRPHALWAMASSAQHSASSPARFFARLTGSCAYLCAQNMTASSKQEQALVHVVQGLLRVCPRASDVTLPHVPAATLRYLVQPAAAHTAMTSLSLLTWNEAPTGDRYHAAFDPAATTRALCSLTRLTTLNLAVLGCGPYGLGSFMKYTRHNRCVHAKVATYHVFTRTATSVQG